MRKFPHDAKKTHRQPKPQTENPSLLGAEIGVGSGAVVVALAKELPQMAWLALDLSARPWPWPGTTPGVMGWPRAPLCPGGPGFRAQTHLEFALMVANLPYVPRAEWEQLPQDIKRF